MISRLRGARHLPLPSALAALVALLGGACADGSGSSAADSDDQQVVTDPDALESRVRRDLIPIDLQPIATLSPKLAFTKTHFSLTQVAEVAPPTLDGQPLYANAIAIAADRAFVAYHRVGPAYGAAVDVYDVADPSNPILKSSSTFRNLDVLDLAADADRLYLAVGGDDLGVEQTAAVAAYDLDAEGMDLSTFRMTPLSSALATSVALHGSLLAVSSGPGGEVTVLDAVTLEVQATKSVADVRAIAVDGTRLVVHAVDELRTYVVPALTADATWPIPSSNDVDARAEVVLDGDVVAATGGSEGVHVVDVTTGELHQTFALPSADTLGVDEADVVANGVAADGDFLFAAEGAGGLVLARSNGGLATAATALPYRNRYRAVFGSDASSNALAASDHVLFLASGSGGLRIIDVQPADAFAVVGATVGFDGESHRFSGQDRPGMGWADFDGDGYLDAALSGDRRYVYLNQRDGTFTRTQPSGGRRGAITFLDADQDGDLDIYSVQQRDFWLNDGAGAFTTVNVSGMPSASQILAVAPLDVDRDGQAEVLGFGDAGNQVGALQSSSPLAWSTTVGSALGFDVPTATGFGWALATADVDDDGWLDVLYDEDATGMHLFVSDGLGGWTLDNRGLSGTIERQGGVAFADFDNDDDLDLAVTRDTTSTNLQLFRNDGGTFVEIAAAAGMTVTDDPQDLDWGDYDNDGYLDLLVVKDGHVDSAIIYRGWGDGTFERLPVTIPGGLNVNCAQFVDYDNDGDLDISLLAYRRSDLLENRAARGGGFSVEVIGAGPGRSPRLPNGAVVRLYSEDGGTFLGRRDIALQRGRSVGQVRAHFGGVDPAGAYRLETTFPSGYVVTQRVVPGEVQATFRGTVVPGVVMVRER